MLSKWKMIIDKLLLQAQNNRLLRAIFPERLSFSRKLNIPLVNKGLPHAVLGFRTKLLQIRLWVSLNNIRNTVQDGR